MRHPTAELITVTYGGDLATLYYHSLSLVKFWSGEKRWTVVVEDESIYQRVIDWITEHIVPKMPGWTVNIKTGPVMAAKDGWHRQQVLKLWIASESQYNYSIIFDSKNFLIKSLNVNDFFDGEKLKVGIFTNSTRGLDIPDPTHTEACRILGVTSASEIHPITPFVWSNSIVRSLLDKLNSLNYNILTEPEIKASEAALYWVYAQDKEDWIDSKDVRAFGQYGGTTRSTRLTPEQLQQQLDQANISPTTHFITLHRFHTTPENAKVVADYLLAKGVVSELDVEFFNKTFKDCFYRMRTEAVDMLHKEWALPPIKTINRNGKLIRFNRIVAYGCSHTAGSELADHDFWPTPITAKDLDKIKRKFIAEGKRSEFYLQEAYLAWSNVLEAGKKLSWPAKVAEKFGVPVDNRAIPGASMQSIIYSIEKDLFYENITEYDLVLIGATSMDRILHFKKEERDGWPVAATPIVGCPWLWPTEKLHDDFVEHIADDYFLFFNYFNALRYLDLLSECHEGRFLVQFMHQTTKNYASYIQNKNLNERFMAMVSSTENFKSIIDNDLAFGNLVHWNDTDNVHGFFHLHEKFHEQIADLIVDKLNNNE